MGQPTKPTERGWITAVELARVLDVSRSYAHRLLRRLAPADVRPGRPRLYRGRAVLALWATGWAKAPRATAGRAPDLDSELLLDRLGGPRA